MGSDTDLGRKPGTPHSSVSAEGFSGTDDIFFAAVETTRMPMVVTDPKQHDNPIVFANEAFYDLCGYPPEEVLGRNCRFLQGPDTDRGPVSQVAQAIQDRTEISTEILNYRKDGSAFWNALFISPIFDKSGDLLYFFASQLDVSRRRDAEEALRQAQKMEAVGQLTGGIAHDFNNLLTVVIGNLEALERGERDPRKLQLIERVMDAAQRGATLTQQLLAFARKQQLDGRPINLNELVRNLNEMVRRTLGEQIQIETRFEPDLWTARVDAVQAELALLNVLINARDAMPGSGGRVTIETANRVLHEEDALTHGDLPPGAYVSLAVTDNGEGMPPEILARVMEPFFTTKEVGKGTGMGLAMVYGFVRQSHGHIRLYSEPGLGTTVRLFFPAIGGEAVRAEAQPRASQVRGGKETVLVVEDNVEVMQLAVGILTDFGYEVLQATNGRDALETIDGGDRVDLLFTDLVMPGGLNGVSVAREARNRQPRIKVLLTTGYAERAGNGEVPTGGFDLIEKPYRRSDLARKVRTILDGHTGVT